jgi:hypothetical protein
VYVAVSKQAKLATEQVFWNEDITEWNDKEENVFFYDFIIYINTMCWLTHYQHENCDYTVFIRLCVLTLICNKIKYQNGNKKIGLKNSINFLLSQLRHSKAPTTSMLADLYTLRNIIIIIIITIIIIIIIITTWDLGSILQTSKVSWHKEIHAY